MGGLSYRILGNESLIQISLANRIVFFTEPWEKHAQFNMQCSSKERILLNKVGQVLKLTTWKGISKLSTNVIYHTYTSIKSKRGLHFVQINGAKANANYGRMISHLFTMRNTEKEKLYMPTSTNSLPINSVAFNYQNISSFLSFDQYHHFTNNLNFMRKFIRIRLKGPDLTQLICNIHLHEVVW